MLWPLHLSQTMRSDNLPTSFPRDCLSEMVLIHLVKALEECELLPGDSHRPLAQIPHPSSPSWVFHGTF